MSTQNLCLSDTHSLWVAWFKITKKFNIIIGFWITSDRCRVKLYLLDCGHLSLIINNNIAAIARWLSLSPEGASSNGNVWATYSMIRCFLFRFNFSRQNHAPPYVRQAIISLTAPAGLRKHKWSAPWIHIIDGFRRGLFFMTLTESRCAFRRWGGYPNCRWVEASSRLALIFFPSYL